MNDNWIDDLIQLAVLLPSGELDPEAMIKLFREQKELLAESDPVERALEGADVMYYAAKAVRARLITVPVAQWWANWAAGQCGLNVVVLAEIARAKYRLRARPGNPKSRGEESLAASRIMAAIDLI